MNRFLAFVLGVMIAQPALAEGASPKDIEQFPLEDEVQYEWEYWSLFPTQIQAKAFTSSAVAKGYSTKVKYIEYSKKYRVIVSAQLLKHEAALLADFVDQEAVRNGGDYLHTTVSRPEPKVVGPNG